MYIFSSVQICTCVDLFQIYRKHICTHVNMYRKHAHVHMFIGTESMHKYILPYIFTENK